MQIRGKLSDRSPADLIEWLHGDRKTGVLRFWHPPGPVRKDVWFEKGEVVSSGTSETHEFLGSFLIASGKITEKDFVRAYRTQVETKVLFGKVLVMFGVVSEREVEVALLNKTEEAIWDVFLWRDGLFEFDDAVTLPSQRLPLKVDARALIREGERRVIEWGVIRQRLPHLNVAVSRTRKSPGDGVTALEKLILDGVGKKPIAEIQLETRLSPFLFLRRLADFEKRGLVQIGAELTDVPLPDGAIAPLTSPGEMPEPAVPIPPIAPPVDPGVSATQRFSLGSESLTAAALKDRIPALAVPKQSLLSMKFSAEEGYLLSRVDGVFDVATVASLCPFREALALSLLCALAGRGIIALQKA